MADCHPVGATPDDETALCRCAQEQIPADKARRLGCDQPGGCLELREAMDV